MPDTVKGTNKKAEIQLVGIILRSTYQYRTNLKKTRASGWDLQENKKFGSQSLYRNYCGMHPFSNKKSSLDKLSRFFFGARYCVNKRKKIHTRTSPEESAHE